MKKIEKLLSAILSLVLLLSLAGVSAFAEDNEYQIVKIEAEDVTLYENLTGSYISESGWGTDGASQAYFHYTEYVNNVKIYMADGKIITGSQSDIDFYFAVSPTIKCDEEQSSENQWTVGNSYTAKFCIGSGVAEFKFNVVENPIAEIIVDDFEIPEFTNGSYNNNNVFTYKPRPSSVKLVYKDGTSEVMTPDEVIKNFEGNRGFPAAEGSDSWTAGNTYPMSCYIGDVVCNYNITVAARSEESKKYVYNNTDGGIEIIRYNGNDENLVIPENIDGKKVVSILNAFNNNADIKTLTLPNGLQKIGNNAFLGCSNLECVSIPDTVTTIGYRAFADCENLKSVYIPQSVETLGNRAFGYYNVSTSRYKTVQGFTIYGITGSEAENYADRTGFNFVSTGEYELPFTDVPKNEWYYDAVLFNYKQDYLHGYGNGSFGPSDIMQRQDFVLLLANIDNAYFAKYKLYQTVFPDVYNSEYYFSAVMWAKYNDIASGYENGNFGVGDAITREQVCRILYNYCQGSVSGDASEILAAFPDGNNVSDWAKEAVAWAAENHIVGGNGTLNPAGNANRAETAQIIMNMANKNIL